MNLWVSSTNPFKPETATGSGDTSKDTGSGEQDSKRADMNIVVRRRLNTKLSFLCAWFRAFLDVNLDDYKANNEISLRNPLHLVLILT